jgi:Arc/MetJ-type ribon-helix-helix transcriptional regulator
MPPFEMFGDASDYVRDLIRRYQERQRSIDEFRALVNQGFASEISAMTMDQIWDLAVDRAKHPLPA